MTKAEYEVTKQWCRVRCLKPMEECKNCSILKHYTEIFGIGKFKNKMVDGGSGWAVQMAIDDGKPVNFYDQDRDAWGRYENGRWSQIETPVLTPNFAGIGTRDINANGVIAIKNTVEKTFGSE